MEQIKCPDCKEGNLRFRFDKVDLDKNDYPEANIYIACEECDYTYDAFIPHPLSRISINCIEFYVKTYKLLDQEGEVDKIRAFSLEEAIEFFKDNQEGEYTIKFLDQEIKIKL